MNYYKAFDVSQDPGGLSGFGRRLLWRYPLRSAVILASFLIAGVMEGISVGFLLPLMGLIQKDAIAPGAGKAHGVNAFAGEIFAFFGFVPRLDTLLFFIVLLICTKAGFSFFAMRNVGYATANMANQLRQDLIRALMRARWPYFSTLSTGQTTNALMTETDRAALSYLNFCKMLADSMLVSVYLVAALFISWKMTALAIVAGCALMGILHQLVFIVRQAGRSQTLHLSSLSGLITDALTNFKPIKAMRREDYFQQLLMKDTKGLWQAKRREVLGLELLNIANEPLIVFCVALGLYGARTYGGFSFSVLIVLAFMFLRVVQKMTSVQMSYQKVMAQESAYWAIAAAIKKAEEASEILSGGRRPELRGAIRLVNVGFTHGRPDGEGENILQNVTCTFPANAISAIIGPSGAGKTTLLDIVLGFYRPQAGRVFVDDIPLEEIDMNAWRESIGYIPQDGFLLHDTVYNNVTLGQNFPAADVERALDKAGILDFIRALPQGLETMAGERGLLFSGGQRQRLTLARALVRRPRLLLLDEPTSALDRETESLLLKTLKELATEMTVIIISHSVRVRDCADRVYILEAGLMKEAGTLSKAAG